MKSKPPYFFKIMINTLTKKEIIITQNLPKLIVIIGPCRVGTTALANIFTKIGLTAYMQPIKSALRAKESKAEIIPWKIIPEKLALTKETLGAETQAEFFDPIKILLALGYPANKLILIPMIRDPRKTLASWKMMWGNLNLENFILAFKLTLKIKEGAEQLGIKTIPYVHEVIRDNQPSTVIQRLFEKTGLRNNSDHMLDWTNDPKFGDENPEISKLKFFDVPPDKFVKEVREWGEYKYREEPYLKLSEKDKLFLKKNQNIIDTYEKFRLDCQKSLNLKIRSFKDINY